MRTGGHYVTRINAIEVASELAWLVLVKYIY